MLANAIKLIEDRAEEFKFLLKAETGQPQMIIDMMQYGAALSGLQFPFHGGGQIHLEGRP